MGLRRFLRKLLRTKPTDGLKSLRPAESILGYHFSDPRLLMLGLTHRSVVRVTETEEVSNERLEFLGDSVLGMVIAEMLYRDYPEMAEGQLTKFKAMLVNEATLAGMAKASGLNQFIRLSPEEDRTGGRERASIISDSFEAVIGAVYLDGGHQAASVVIDRLIYANKENIISDSSQRNYKGELLEMSQSRGEGAPRYDVVSEEGPDHEKIFYVAVTIAGEQIGEGSGLSKKEAEQKAASAALQRYTSLSS
ncbi:MAG: ribonuclease III [candidate division Zixibacteria bacterium]|nr:ribonuclease III [candidate division Zixibacteria bacterium]